MKEPLNTSSLPEVEEQHELLPDFTDIEDVKKAFIANEIFNRKY
jgi:hypothetical protein